MLPKTFADNLKYFRTQASLTQEELAKKVGYSRKTIVRCEEGSQIPNLILLEDLATALEKTPIEMLTEHAEASKVKKRNKSEYIYMLVSNDELETPLAVADSAAELGKMLGTSSMNITSSARKNEKTGLKTKYRRVKKEEQE